MSTRNPYKFYTKTLPDGRIKTIAISTYAGRTVRGSTICDINDSYDKSVGQRIAAIRCGAKIAQKRLNRAAAKRLEAEQMLQKAQTHYSKMVAYYNDALEAQMQMARLVGETIS